MDSQSQLAVKVKYGDQLRRFILQTNSFAEFSKEIRNLFQVDPNLALQVKYLDDEGDEIIMSSDAELICAIDMLPPAPGRCLKVFVQAHQPAVQPLPGAFPTAQPMFYPYPMVPSAQPSNSVELWREAVKQRKMEKLEQKFDQKIERKMQKMAVGPNRTPMRPLMARLVSHVTVPDGQEFGPDVTFNKTWRLRNDGTQPWTANYTFLRVSRTEDALNAPLSVPLGQEVAPGWEVDVTVPMRAPVQPGAYESFWRLCTPEGRKFGQRVRCKVAVVASSEDDSSEAEQPKHLAKEAMQQRFAALRDKYQAQLTILQQMGFQECDRKLLKQLDKHQGNLDRVLDFIVTRKQKSAGVVAQH